MGLIAQDLEKLYPFLVEIRSNGYKAIRYDRLIALLVEGMKELAKISHEPQNYRDECEELKDRVAQLEKKIEEMTNGNT
jgi:cell division protein FtsB